MNGNTEQVYFAKSAFQESSSFSAPMHSIKVPNLSNLKNHFFLSDGVFECRGCNGALLGVRFQLILISNSTTSSRNEAYKITKQFLKTLDLES